MNADNYTMFGIMQLCYSDQTEEVVVHERIVLYRTLVYSISNPS